MPQSARLPRSAHGKEAAVALWVKKKHRRPWALVKRDLMLEGFGLDGAEQEWRRRCMPKKVPRKMHWQWCIGEIRSAICGAYVDEGNQRPADEHIVVHVVGFAPSVVANLFAQTAHRTSEQALLSGGLGGAPPVGQRHNALPSSVVR